MFVKSTFAKGKLRNEFSSIHQASLAEEWASKLIGLGTASIGNVFGYQNNFSLFICQKTHNFKSIAITLLKINELTERRNRKLFSDY